MLSTLTLSACAQQRLNRHLRWTGPAMSEPISLPVCSICDESVQLETSKTDENGRAVHEECYVLKVKLMLATIPSLL
jgi:hypothetical protein